jgi:pimeloyl-ACP methyl ester carboxylesterase
VRTVIDIRGQRVSATNRLYLAAELPTMIIWGEHDPLIPVAHAYSAHDSIAGSRLEVFPNAGHFPHRDNPQRFVQVLVDFMQSSVPAHADEQKWRERLRTGAAAR